MDNTQGFKRVKVLFGFYIYIYFNLTPRNLFSEMYVYMYAYNMSLNTTLASILS